MPYNQACIRGVYLQCYFNLGLKIPTLLTGVLITCISIIFFPVDFFFFLQSGREGSKRSLVYLNSGSEDDVFQNKTKIKKVAESDMIDVSVLALP